MVQVEGRAKNQQKMRSTIKVHEQVLSQIMLKLRSCPRETENAQVEAVKIVRDSRREKTWPQRQTIGAVARFVIMRSCGCGSTQRQSKDKDKVGLDCLPWSRQGEGDYIRECETSTLRVSRVEGEEERARQRRKCSC